MSEFFEGLLVIGGVVVGAAAAMPVAFAVARVMVWIGEKCGAE